MVCVDDLEKTPLNQLAYNGKLLTVSGQERLAPAYNFADDHKTRKLICSSYLFLTIDCQANCERREGKRPPLKRIKTNASQLPLQARAESGDSSGILESASFIETDRSGVAAVMIKNFAKDKKEHTAFSQQSTALQHTEDFVQLAVATTRRNAPKKYASLQKVLGKNGKVTPYLILASDGASEHSIRLLQNVLPLWEMLRVLDLDGIEKLLFCPGHSKDNPDEMVNRTVKRQLKGRFVDAGEAGPEEMELAKKAMADVLCSKTHAGEPLHAFVAPAGGVKWNEQDRRKFEFTFDYETLYPFAVERAKYARWFADEEVPAEVIQQWKTQEETGFWALEQLTQEMKKHIRYINLYGIALRKCHESATACKFCKDHLPRGLFLRNAAREFDLEECDREHPCPIPICKHKLNKEYREIFDELQAITPPDLLMPRLCSRCKEPGHDKRKCSKQAPDDPKQTQRKKKK